MSDIRADTISDAAGTGPIALTKQSAAKAWINVDQTGTQSILSSFNVSSITDGGTGRTSFSLTSSFLAEDWTGVTGQSASTSIDIVIGGELSASSGFMRFRASGADTDASGAASIGHGDLA